MVKKFFKKKKAMTLAALLITMALTSILLGMFVPLLVQGLVNIANGKEFDGSVSLSNRNGFFMCYYDNAGRLMQSRADVNPNGRDIDLSTSVAGAGGCSFNVPTWPDSFRVTLIGGGGAGATPSFNVFDEEFEPEDCSSFYNFNPQIDGNIISYVFDNESDNYCIIRKLIDNINICLNNNVGVELFEYVEQDELTKNYSIKINMGDRSAEYNVGNNKAVVQSSPRYSSVCSNDTTTNGFCDGAAITQERVISSACASPSFFLTKTRNLIPFGSVLELGFYRSGINVNIAQGGRLGQKTENIVPYFETVNGILTISPASIGVGGRVGVNNGRGGTTRLTLPGGNVISADGGLSGSFESEHFYDDGNIGAIPTIVRGGQNGEIDRFIPATLRITDLLRGRGAANIDEPAGNASYPGSGGGGGAIALESYNNAAVRSGNSCVNGRVSLIVQGDDNIYELECSPNLNQSDFRDIDTFRTVVEGGNGAPGAILIAW